MIDVVTDDMPFLVDTITMTLATHDVTPELVVHPQLHGPPRRDRRAARGAEVDRGPRWARPARCQRRRDAREPDQIAESWSHIEVARLTDGKADGDRGGRWSRRSGRRADGGRGLPEDAGDGRAAGRSAGLGASAAATGRAEAASEVGPDRGRSRRPRSKSCCAGWSTPTSPSSATASTTWCNEAAGLALRGVPRHRSRHPAARQGQLDARCRHAAGRARARHRPSHRLIMTKANTRATVHRPSYLDYIGIKRLSDGRSGDRRVPVPRAVHPHGLHREHHQDPDPAPQARPRSTRRAASPPTATTAGTWPSSWRSTRARSCSRPRSASWPTSPARCCGCASGCRPGCSCARTSTAGTSPAWSTCPGTGTTPRSGWPCRTSCGACSAARRSTTARWSDEAPIARLHIVVRAERGQKLVDADVAAARAGDRRRRPVLGRRPGQGGGEPSSASGPGRALLAEFTGSISETYKADVPAAAASLRPGQDPADAEPAGQDIAFEMWESAGYVGGVPVEYER